MPARHPLDRSRSLHPELAERSRALRVWCRFLIFMIWKLYFNSGNPLWHAARGRSRAQTSWPDQDHWLCGSRPMSLGQATGFSV